MSISSQLLVNIKNAFKENLLPALFLQVIALILGYCYFFLPSAQPVFNFVAQLKSQHGGFYAMCSTAIFGGLIPYLYLLSVGRIKFKPIQQAIFYCLLWAFIGLLVDYFYSWQAIWFGNNNNVETIVAKTFIDQFIFSALLTCPFITVAYLWKDNQFNYLLLKDKVNKSLFTLKIPTLVVTNWLIWIPSVSLIYMMPLQLQVPLFNVVLCFFVIVLAVLTNEADD